MINSSKVKFPSPGGREKGEGEITFRQRPLITPPLTISRQGGTFGEFVISQRLEKVFEAVDLYYIRRAKEFTQFALGKAFPGKPDEI